MHWSRVKTVSSVKPATIGSATTDNDGGFAVISQQGSGIQVVKCGSSFIRTTPDTDPTPGETFPLMSYSPSGAVNLVWGKGCHGEECQPGKVVAQRGR